MSTLKEKIEAIKHAVEASKRRLRELDSLDRLTKANWYERDMTLDCISRGERLIAAHTGEEPRDG